ncbi:MAG: hypothetical protein C4318_05930 [Acidimicrobiia bacterium]
MLAVVAIGLLYLILLYVAGRRQRELHRSRADHPAARSKIARNTTRIDKASLAESVVTDRQSSASQSQSVNSDLQMSGSACPRLSSLLELVEAAAHAVTDAAPSEQRVQSLEDIVRAIPPTQFRTRRYRSGVVIEHRGQSVFLTVLEWDGHSRVPANRTFERLIQEMGEAGCATMAIVTDAPRAHCKTYQSWKNSQTFVIPAEGVGVLVKGLEALS